MYNATARATFVVSLAIVVLTGVGCRRTWRGPPTGPRLAKLAHELETAYGRGTLPEVSEPATLVDRLRAGDDFRTCCVRTYVARRPARDQAPAPERGSQSSLGAEAVEACATTAAVASRNPLWCEALAAAFPGPAGTLSSGGRCTEALARVRGAPDECPVGWLASERLGRNPECLAVARRDASPCAFATRPAQCHAVVTQDPAACPTAGDDAADCTAAASFWSGAYPTPDPAARPVLPPEDELEHRLGLTIEVRRDGRGEAAVTTVRAPARWCAVSFPERAGANAALATALPDPARFVAEWGALVNGDGVMVTTRGEPSLLLAWRPAGRRTGVLRWEPVGPGALATLALAWNHGQRRCAPTPATTGELNFAALQVEPGGTLTARIEARGLLCTDGTQVDVRGRLDAIILDVR